MKFIQLVLLGLIATAVLAKAHKQVLDSGKTEDVKEQIHQGETEDDYNEASDVAKSSTETKDVKITGEKTYQLSAEEILEEEYEINATVPKETKTWEEKETLIVDGKTVERVVTKSYAIYDSVKVRRIKTFWKRSDKLDTVKPLAIKFAAKYGQRLTEQEIALFNQIAVTDGIKFESKYNYFQFKHGDQLERALRAALEVYATKLPDLEVSKLYSRIESCQDGAIAEVVNSDAAETHSQNQWTVITQVFLATCKPQFPVVQVLTWYGAKSGGYKAGKWSQANAATVDRIITKFLNAQLGLIFTCKDSPVLQGDFKSSFYEKNGDLTQSGSKTGGEIGA
jgi:predicted HNH restriction endonuclease